MEQDKSLNSTINAIVSQNYDPYKLIAIGYINCLITLVGMLNLGIKNNIIDNSGQKVSKKAKLIYMAGGIEALFQLILNFELECKINPACQSDKDNQILSASKNYYQQMLLMSLAFMAANICVWAAVNKMFASEDKPKQAIKYELYKPANGLVRFSQARDRAKSIGSEHVTFDLEQDSAKNSSNVSLLKPR